MERTNSSKMLFGHKRAGAVNSITSSCELWALNTWEWAVGNAPQIEGRTQGMSARLVVHLEAADTPHRPLHCLCPLIDLEERVLW